MTLLRMYRAQFRMTFAMQSQYRVAMIIWLLGLVLQPIMYLAVWSAVTRSTGGSVGGFTARDFAGYFIILMIVNQLTFSWIIYGFDQRIRQGSFSPLLLRPLHVVHVDLADNITYKVLTLPVIGLAVACLVWAYDPSIHPSPQAVLGFVVALPLACALRFTFDWTLALVAFWITRVGALDQMYEVLVLFLTGQVAPIALFPASVQFACSVLPFRWMVSFPVEMLQGRLSSHDILLGLAAQIGWLAAGQVLLRITWRAGIKRYSAVGA